MNDHIKSPFQKQVRATQMIRAASRQSHQGTSAPSTHLGGPCWTRAPSLKAHGLCFVKEGGQTDKYWHLRAPHV